MKRAGALQGLTALAAAGVPRRAGAQAKAAYKIGVTFPLTGPFAVNASEYLPALEIARDEVNAAGGVGGHPLAFVVEDTQATPQGGVAAFRKVASVDRVQVVLSVYTNVVTAQIPLADQLRIPNISTIETPGVATKGRYSYSHAPQYSNIVPLERDYWKAKRYRRIFLLIVNNALGQVVSPLVREAALAAGAEYGEAPFDLGQTDYRGIITRAKEFNPDAILVQGGGGGDEGVVIKQLRELDLRQQLFTMANNYRARAWRDAVGPYAEGVILGGLNVDATTAPAFVHKFKQRLGYVPGYQPAEFYDVLHMVAFAIGKAGYDGDGIRNVIAGLRDFPSVMGGKVSMAEDHYTRPPLALWLVRHGELVRIGR
jgi:branched-chain amino acid transport system substrate-binding protein